MILKIEIEIFIVWCTNYTKLQNVFYYEILTIVRKNTSTIFVI